MLPKNALANMSQKIPTAYTPYAMVKSRNGFELAFSARLALSVLKTGGNGLIQGLYVRMIPGFYDGHAKSGFHWPGG